MKREGEPVYRLPFFVVSDDTEGVSLQWGQLRNRNTAP